MSHTNRLPKPDGLPEVRYDVPGYPRPADVTILHSDRLGGLAAVMFEFAPESVAPCRRCPEGCRAARSHEDSSVFWCAALVPPEDAYNFIFGPSTNRAKA
jgi:hypothetical protein